MGWYGVNKIDAVMRRFPDHAYNSEKSPVLYKVIESILHEFNIVVDSIDRLYNALDINTVSPDDIHNRFGALLNINKNQHETDEQYRDRLRTSVIALSGGTAQAIKYAIACGLGINNDDEAMDRMIHVYDAWKYNGDAEVYKEYGYVVCTIDLGNNTYSRDIEHAVIEATNNVKASGIIIQFVYNNFRTEYYIELNDMTYANLSTLIYNQVGE